MKKELFPLVVAILFNVSAGAQQADVMAKLGYPQTIVYNGKIVTMDDASFESRVGTIVQAMAIRDGNILATGTNIEIRPLAGPQTRQIDLKGRTVLPSFTMTHEHPTDWAFQDGAALSHAVPEDNDFLVYRFLEGPAEKQFAAFEPTLKDAVAKAKPGQWILISFTWGSQYEYAVDIQRRFPQSLDRTIGSVADLDLITNKQRLDYLAPNNPVTVKNGLIAAIINSRALEELKKVHPAYRDPLVEQQGGPTLNRAIESNLIFKDRTELLAEVLKAELELWAAHGITHFESSPYAYNNLHALAYLARTGQMPARFGWGYWGSGISFTDEEGLRYITALLGQGNDYLWNVGGGTGVGGSCRTFPASPEVKAGEQCSSAPGSIGRENAERWVRAGGRLATQHTEGDLDIDYMMDAIEKASKEAGMTLEEIRAKRHTFDHGGGAPRYDQLPRIKNLGMMVSEQNTNLWENGRSYNASEIARNYGAEYTNFVAPRMSVTKAGIMNTFEIDRAIPHMVFFFVLKGITRYNDRDKKVYGPAERTDRIIQLKALTRWGGYAMLRENLLGSLEPGKYADFIVLDRDYLAIPEDDIPNIKVLMTLVGGKVIHLMPSLAREIGMEPVGPATWPEKPLENYFKWPR